MGTKAKFYVATSSGWVEANFGSTGSGSFYGVSSESSTTRTATLTNDNGNFELVVGATVNIKFTHASSSGSMTLNVNNTGDKPIKQNSSNTTEWKAGAIINLVYDGSNWIVSGVGSTVDTDKKTASTPSNEKLYLIGSTAQGTDGQATYSNSNVYTKNGVIYANGVNTSSISSNSSIAFYAGGGGESSIEYSNISGTGIISNGHFISYGDDDNSNENKPANKTDFTDLDSYYFNTGITLYDSDSSRKYKLSFPAKSGTFATLDDTKIEAGTGLQLSGTTFSANLNSTTSLGTIGSTSKLYPVGVDASGKLAVYVPWVDTNTDTHYTNYFQIKGNGTEAIKFTQNADKSLNFKPGNNVSISAATNEITISVNVPTKVSDLTDSSDYALKSDITSLFKFQGSLTSINNLPTSSEPGDVYNISNAFTANNSFPNDNGKSFPAGTNVVYVSGESNNYWEVLGGTYSNATTTTSGLMSSNDKSKLDGIADNANNYSHPSTHPASMITGLAKVATSGQYSDLSGALTLSGNGSATTAARSDHNHNGVYSPIGHTHSDYITSQFLGQNYYTKKHIDDNFAKATHTHGNITSKGELDTASRIVVTDASKKITTGTIDPASIVLTNDSRLSDARTPTEHTQAGTTITGPTASAQGDRYILTNTGDGAESTWMDDSIYARANQIPAVNNATLTIQKNGVNVATFTANSATNTTANIAVPTKVSDLSDASDYAKKSDISSIFEFKGSLDSISKLPTSVEPGDVYNISVSFTADSKFHNDSGKTFPAGTNVVYVADDNSNYWEVLGGTYSEATASVSGLMSSGDKTKLDGIETGANKYIHPNTHAASMITGLATVATTGSYSDLTNKPTSLKNPYALSFGSKTYDGSSAITLTLDDLGGAPSYHTHTSLVSNTDNRNDNTTPNDYNAVFKISGLKTNSVIGISNHHSYSCVLGVRGWGDSSGGNAHEIALTGDGYLMHRNGATTSWSDWKTIAYTSDIPDWSSAGNAAANKVVSRNATGSIQTEKLAVSSGTTTKATMQYNATEDCIEFIFA